MIYKFQIFNCWQSDDKEARKIIKNALNKAKDKLASKGYEVDIIEGAAGELGMAKIDDAVLKNIRDCDVFVCDLTPVAELKDEESYKVKAMPNSNVLVELGYALALKGANRMIGLARKGNISHDHMPFDIRQMRFTPFTTVDHLNSLSSWIQPMLDEIKQEGMADPDYAADVSVLHGGNPFIAHPKYWELQFDLNGKDSLPNQKKKSVGNGFWLEMNPIDYTTYTNHSLVSIRLCISNTGKRMLENCKLTITTDDRSVSFVDDNREGGMAIIRSINDPTSVTEIGVTHQAGNINPKDTNLLSEFYIKSDYQIKEFNLNWRLSTHVDQRIEGTIHIKWEPVFVPYKINFQLEQNEPYILECKMRNK